MKFEIKFRGKRESQKRELEFWFLNFEIKVRGKRKREKRDAEFWFWSSDSEGKESWRARKEILEFWIWSWSVKVGFRIWEFKLEFRYFHSFLCLIFMFGNLEPEFRFCVRVWKSDLEFRIWCFLCLIIRFGNLELEYRIWRFLLFDQSFRFGNLEV